MALSGVYREELVRVLEVDPTLADGLPDDARDQALLLAVAEARWIDRGPWTPAREAADRAGHLGLLIVDGLVARSARLVEHEYVELLGPGDLLRPWQAEHSAPFDAGSARWDVLEMARVAVLDRRFSAIVGRWPEVISALTERAVRRSRDMALALAVAQIPKVEMRLLVLLWHIAERFGTPGESGTALPVPITHDVLAKLAVARRPTITLALGRLVERGVIERRDDRILVLRGDAPRQLATLRQALG
jgi:hypothetical protein